MLTGQDRGQTREVFFRAWRAHREGRPLEGVTEDEQYSMYRSLIEQVPPELVTVAESGYPGFSADSWFGFVVPAKTPPAIIDKLHNAVTRIMATPEMKTQVVNNGADPMAMGPAEFGRFLQNESAKWAQVAKAANLRIE